MKCLQFLRVLKRENDSKASVFKGAEAKQLVLKTTTRRKNK